MRTNQVALNAVSLVPSLWNLTYSRVRYIMPAYFWAKFINWKDHSDKALRVAGS